MENFYFIHLHKTAPVQCTSRSTAHKEGAQIHKVLKLKTPSTHKPIGNRQMKIRVMKT